MIFAQGTHLPFYLLILHFDAAQKAPVVSWAASKAAWQQVKGGDAVPLLCSLCPALGSRPQGRPLG